MDRRDLESRGGLHDRERRLLELLRNANGREAGCHGDRKVCRPNAEERWSGCVDGQDLARREDAQRTLRMAEATQGLRQFDVRLIPSRRAR